MKDTTLFKEDFIRDFWATGNGLAFNGKVYRVGRMSYGEYFLEPGLEHGERAPFNRGTLWLERSADKKHLQIAE